MPGLRVRLLGVAAILTAVLAVVLAACSGSDGDAPSGSSSSSGAAAAPSFEAPDGVTLTKAGSTLEVGQSATVGFSQNAKRQTALTMTVTRMQTGRVADLSAYSLDQQAATATPYYVSVSVRNAGPGDVGRAAIPLWGLSSDGSLRGASSFTPTFSRCPSSALPATFATGAGLNTCLVYLMPKGTQLAGVSYRPVQSQEPVVWKGTVLPVAAAKK